jgi:hypothetical protein
VPYTWHQPVNDKVLKRQKTVGITGMASEAAPVISRAAVYLLVAVIAAIFAVAMNQSLVLAVGGAIFVLASALALWHPRAMVVVALCGGIVAADYLTPPGWPFSIALNGVRVLAVLLVCCGLGALITSGMDSSVRPYAASAALLTLAWFMVPLGIDRSGHPDGVLSFLGLRSSVELAAMLGVLAVCGTVKGRLAVLRGLAAAGGLAAIAAVVEMALGSNPLLDLASDKSLIELWLAVPDRFGLHRAAVGFGHPILLGVFFGIAMLATLELARRGGISESWAVTLVAADVLGLVTTLSRGPLLAIIPCLCLWAIGARKMQKWRQVVLLAIVAVSIGLTVWSVAFGGRAEELLIPSSTEMGRTSEHRISLASAFFTEVRKGSLFGVYDVNDTAVAKRFGHTLDNEGLYAYESRGLSGLLLITVILLAPAVVMLLRPSIPRQQRLFPVLLGLFLLIAGVNVAYFGQLMPYLAAVAAVAWTALSEAPEVAIDGVAPGNGLSGVASG